MDNGTLFRPLALVGSIMYGLVLAAGFFPAISIALKCSDVVRAPQSRISYIDGDATVTRIQLGEHIRANFGANIEIPKVCDDSVRIATYDINNLKDLYQDPDNVDKLEVDLIQINAAVVAFQRVPLYTATHRRKFDQMLDRLGYIHQFFNNSKASFGVNVIASKIPGTSIKLPNSSLALDMLAVEMRINERNFAVVSVNIDPSIPIIVERQAKEIVKSIQSHVKKDHQEYALIGGFYSADPKSLTATGVLRDSFASLGWPVPSYTCWDNTVTDYMFVSPRLAGKLYGAYVYYTDSSDHFPILLDIKAPGVGKKVSRVGLSIQGWIVIVFGVLLMTVTAGLGIYHWVLSYYYY